jgi:hypothetical protein
MVQCGRQACDVLDHEQTQPRASNILNGFRAKQIGEEKSYDVYNVSVAYWKMDNVPVSAQKHLSVVTVVTHCFKESRCWDETCNGIAYENLRV